MYILTIWALRLFGISGIIGSVLFICGDLFYNHIPGSKDTPTVKMSRLPQARLLNAGTLGLIGCWFYTLASMHIYLAFRPAGELFAFFVMITLGAVMIGYGMAHAAYFAIGAGAQVAANAGLDAEEGGRMGNALFQRFSRIIYLPVAVSSLLMLDGIVAGRSLYPRWMAFLLPIVIYLLKTPVVRLLKGRVRELVNDSYDNIVWLVFFVISSIVLWNAAVI